MPNLRVSSSFLKKGFDLLVGMVLLAFLAPVLLFIALLIKLETKGPILTKQGCLGLNGQLFNIYKFRTAFYPPKRVSPTLGYAPRDPTLTRVGRILKWTTADQLPLLLNIILGQMSFVGPRPHPIDRSVEYAALMPNYKDRFQAQPGLTGLSQIRGLSETIMSKADLERQLACDLEYIETWSIGLDLATLLRTMPSLFGIHRAG